MRARALVGSAVVHIAVFAALAYYPRQHSATTTRSAPPPLDLVDVVVLDEPVTTLLPADREPPTAHREPPAVHRPPPSVAVAASASVAAPESAAATGSAAATDSAPASGTSSLFHMRGADLAVTGGEAQAALSRIADAASGYADGEGPPEPAHRSGRLDNAPGGRAVIRDRVATIDVARDGTARIRSAADIDIHFHLPIIHVPDFDKFRHELGTELRDWYADPEAGKRYNRTQDLPEHLRAAEGSCDSWFDLMCDDVSSPEFKKRSAENENTDAPVTGKLDLTAWLAKRHGVGDVYSARKLALLDATRDERVERGNEFRARQRTHSAELIARNLDQLWAAVRDPADRRRALFELWDECAEGTGAEGAAGARARAMVIGWIRAKLPHGSPEAYSDDELAQLSAHRTSHAPFSPYE